MSDDIELIKLQMAIRAAISSAYPLPVREADLAKQLKADTANVRHILDGMSKAGEIITCALIAGGIEQMEVKLSTAAGGPEKFRGQLLTLSPRSAADNKRRSEQLDAETKGLLRIPGSAGLRTPTRRLFNLAAIGPTDPPAPTPAEPSRTTTQETRTMSKTNGTADTVAAALTSTPQTVAAIAVATGLDEKAVSNALQRLKPAGKARREGRGLWVSVVPRAASAATAPLVKPAAEKKSKPAKPPARSKKVGSFKLNVEIDTSQAIAQIGQLKDLSQSPVNILKLEGGDLLVLRGNIVKAQLDPAEVDALRKAA